MNELAGQRVLLGISGGIAAYKTPDLVRRLRERGAEVQVVLTPGAKAFVTPLSLQAVSGSLVRSELLDTAAEAAMGHIELARWANHILIAPASADLIARLAAGMANDLLTTLCLATDAPIALAPAMNRLMWANPATQANVLLLQQRGMQMFGPGSGEQACGEVGAGRMLDPLELVERLIDGCAGPAKQAGSLGGKKVLITAGPTREPIDPVRYITNRSSGKMGFAVAAAAVAAGADVTLIAGPVNLPTPAGVTRINVETATEMHAATTNAASGQHIFIASAAVADYRPQQCGTSKIKKNADEMTIGLTRNADILADTASAQPGLFAVGFAAETDQLESYARDKLERKKLDMVAGNWVGGGKAFDRDDNELLVVWPGGQQLLPSASKTELAEQLVQLIAERYAESGK